MIAFLGSAENAFSWRADHLDTEIVQLEGLISGGGRHGGLSIDRAAMSSCWTEQHPTLLRVQNVQMRGGPAGIGVMIHFERPRSLVVLKLHFWDINARTASPLAGLRRPPRYGSFRNRNVPNRYDLPFPAREKDSWTQNLAGNLGPSCLPSVQTRASVGVSREALGRSSRGRM